MTMTATINRVMKRIARKVVLSHLIVPMELKYIVFAFNFLGLLAVDQYLIFRSMDITTWI